MPTCCCWRHADGALRPWVTPERSSMRRTWLRHAGKPPAPGQARQPPRGRDLGNAPPGRRCCCSLGPPTAKEVACEFRQLIVDSICVGSLAHVQQVPAMFKCRYQLISPYRETAEGFKRRIMSLESCSPRGHLQCWRRPNARQHVERIWTWSVDGY